MGNSWGKRRKKKKAHAKKDNSHPTPTRLQPTPDLPQPLTTDTNPLHAPQDRKTDCSQQEEEYSYRLSLLSRFATSFTQQGKGGFLLCSGHSEKIIRETWVRGIVMDTLVSGQGLVNFFGYHLESKIRLEKRYLSHDIIRKRWKTVVNLLRVTETR